MDEKIVQQILDELLSSFEPLDTKNAALLLFLKAKGIATDEELAPFLEQAGNASSVRWLAAKVRIGSLISSAMKSAEQIGETDKGKSTPKRPEPAADTSKETAQTKEAEVDVQPVQGADDNSKSEDPSPAVAEKDENKKETRSANKDTKETAKENAA